MHLIFAILKEEPNSNCSPAPESLLTVTGFVWIYANIVITHSSRRSQPSCSQHTGTCTTFFSFFYFVVGMHITQKSSVYMHVTTRLYGGIKDLL